MNVCANCSDDIPLANLVGVAHLNGKTLDPGAETVMFGIIMEWNGFLCLGTAASGSSDDSDDVSLFEVKRRLEERRKRRKTQPRGREARNSATGVNKARVKRNRVRLSDSKGKPSRKRVAKSSKSSQSSRRDNSTGISAKECLVNKILIR